MIQNTISLVFIILLWGFLLTSTSIIILTVLGYCASKPISYLPKINSDQLKPHLNEISRQFELKNSSYILLVDENGVINVKTTKGEVIMSNLKYYVSYEGINEKWGLDKISVKLFNDSTVSIMGAGPLGVQVSLLLTVPKLLPKLDINIRTIYNNNIVVRREALVAGFDVPVSEVYLKNRKIKVDSFDSEYWLQRQGVRFGYGDRSALVYHTPNVSSMQLNSEKKLLFINLEYFLDHPYIYIPFLKDGGDLWTYRLKNLSAANYSSGAERNNNFSIYFGILPKVIPRLMLVPDGYIAGYVFTEHADQGDLKRNRAIYFGNENISNIDSTVGGFAGHRIPVTKSVFYTDTNGCSVRDNPQFCDFLDQLYKTGLYDICLHTPEPGNSNRKILEESIKFMKEKFDATTWIDHGFGSGNSNRESFVCDGLNPASEYYAADLWEKYNTRYFWNTSNESIGVLSLKEEIRKLRLIKASAEIWKRYSSKPELNSLQPAKGNSLPTPLYWQNLTKTKLFYSWGTNYVKDYSNLLTHKANDQLTFEQRYLNKLLTDWGVFIQHGYFSRNSIEYNPGTCIEHEGKIVINPYFEKILEVIARMRDEENLYITTIRDLLDYWILIENVTFEYMPNGIINVYNNNDKPIKGLSLVMRTNSVLLNGEIPMFKRVGEDIIFWFDISTKDHVSLQVE